MSRNLNNQKRTRRGLKGLKLIFVDPSAIDAKLETGQARAVQALSFSSPENPFFQSLTDEEQQVYALYRTGLKQRRIGVILGLNEYAVCTILKSIREYLQRIKRFREILLQSSGYIDAFLLGRHCSRSETTCECGHCHGSATCNDSPSNMEAD